MKNKETLEEATKNWITKNSGTKSLLTPEFVRESFKEGAKWQQERMYSEEEVRTAIFTSFLLGVDRGNYSKELEDKLIEQFKNK
jgi:hypothetical protein